jgi:hypothetical protein
MAGEEHSDGWVGIVSVLGVAGKHEISCIPASNRILDFHYIASR